MNNESFVEKKREYNQEKSVHIVNNMGVQPKPMIKQRNQTYPLFPYMRKIGPTETELSDRRE